MEKTYRGNILEITDARIIYRNFAGEQTKFNAKGNRNFAVIIPTQELYEELLDEGWNVKRKDPREEYEDDQPLMYLPVAVKFNHNGPSAYLRSGDSVTRLNEGSIDMLDKINISSVDVDIRPHDWEVNGKTGRKAYLDAIQVIQKVDKFGARYAAEGISVNE